jgi:hypothetical protein
MAINEFRAIATFAKVVEAHAQAPADDRNLRKGDRGDREATPD